MWSVLWIESLVIGMLRWAMWTWVISDIVLSSRAIAVEGPLSCPCSDKKFVVVWYRQKCWQPRINSLIMAYVNIKMHMVDKMYTNMYFVLQDVVSIVVVTSLELVMYRDKSFLRLSCLKYKNTKRMNATRAMMQDTNMNIMLESTSSLSQESISKSCSASFAFCIIDWLKSLLSLRKLSEFLQIYFVLFYIANAIVQLL